MIVTTSQSVLLLNCLSGRANVLHRGAGLYYGIARAGDGYAVAARRRLVSSSVPLLDEQGCILQFDQSLQQSGVLEAPFPLLDMHQIACFDDRLWITCSYDDMIVTYDGTMWDRWYPLAVSPEALTARSPDEMDRYHYNSFFTCGDELVLLAHNRGPSELHFFDRRSRAWRRSIALGVQSHNIWMEDGAYFTCSSIDGKLVSTSGWELITGAFPRGVCFGPANRAIGISALSERGQRDWASAAIAVYDAAWRLRHYVHLVREGMVLDLAPISDAESIPIENSGVETLQFPLLANVTSADLTDNQGSSGDVLR